MRPLLARIAAIALIMPVMPAFGQTTPTQANSGEQEKMVCRKFLETGSLVKKRKICMTQSEWRRVQTSQNEGSRKMIEELSGGFNCAATNSC